MTTTSAPHQHTGTAARPPTHGRIRVVAGALAAAAATASVLLATTPWGERLDSGSDQILSYDTLVTVHDAAWASMLLDGFAYAVIGLALGLGVLHLARGRGRVLALLGAVITTAGGVLFAMGAAAMATIVWFAGADGLADGSGQTLVDVANSHPGHLMGPSMAGFLLTTVGVLVLAGALFRARAVPVFAVVAYVVLVLAQFSPIPGRAMDFLQIAMMLVLIGFAAVLWRADV
jgi:hypothetical protein